jgi:hypothetical protein
MPADAVIAPLSSSSDPGAPPMGRFDILST